VDRAGNRGRHQAGSSQSRRPHQTGPERPSDAGPVVIRQLRKNRGGG